MATYLSTCRCFVPKYFDFARASSKKSGRASSSSQTGVLKRSRRRLGARPERELVRVMLVATLRAQSSSQYSQCSLRWWWTWRISAPIIDRLNIIQYCALLFCVSPHLDRGRLRAASALHEGAGGALSSLLDKFMICFLLLVVSNRFYNCACFPASQTNGDRVLERR